MFVIGLTGGIATGKSTVSQMFKQHGSAIFNADDAVHKLMKMPQIIDIIQQVIPQAILSGKIDRKILGEMAFYDSNIIKFLERLFHPLVNNMEAKYRADMKRLGYKLLICDIPLLFETCSEKRFDMTITVTCPSHIQRQRALARPNMTEDKLEHILDRQMPQFDKIHHADSVISTGLNKAHSMKQVKALLLNKGLL